MDTGTALHHLRPAAVLKESDLPEPSTRRRYLDRVEQAAGVESYWQYWGQHLHELNSLSVGTYLVTDDATGTLRWSSGAAEVDKLLELRKHDKACVLILSNITEELINRLGSAVGIDPCSLAEHLGNFVSTGDPYRPLKPSRSFEQRYRTLGTDHALAAGEDVAEDTNALTTFRSLIGDAWLDGRRGGYSSRRRVSYCQLWQHGWLFLVSDQYEYVPVPDTSSPFNRILKFQNWYRGPAIPLSLSRLSTNGSEALELFETMIGALEDSKHSPRLGKAMGQRFTSLLFRGIPESTDVDLWIKNFNRVFGLIMVASAWRSNIDHLEDRLRDLQPAAISNPTMHTFMPLTTLRRNLADLRVKVYEAKRDIERHDEEILTQLMDGLEGSVTIHDVFEEVLDQADHLAETLGKEIQLVIGAVQVRDSDNMKRQADRTLLLTLLAALYLPLTLVTGIFGMNIKEINGSTPQYRTSLRVAGLVLVVTGVLFVAGHYGRKWYRRLSEHRKVSSTNKEEYKMA